MMEIKNKDMPIPPKNRLVKEDGGKPIYTKSSFNLACFLFFSFGFIIGILAVAFINPK